MDNHRYRYNGDTVAGVTLRHPPITLTLYPGKEYKLPCDNPHIQNLVQSRVLEDLGAVQVNTKPKSKLSFASTEE